jgi:aspartate racemase
MEQAIGVIGGVGPYAGLDLVKKVFDNTMARSDQEHVDLYMTSCPSLIGDRTRYLLEGGDNPAERNLVSFEKLALIGATVIVNPCNTAHAPAIFDVVHTRAESSHPGVRLVNMIRETCATLDRMFPHGAPIGLLATKGTHAVGVYRQYIGRYPKLQLIEPDTEARERVHQAIYDPMYGIKAGFPPAAWGKWGGSSPAGRKPSSSAVLSCLLRCMTGCSGASWSILRRFLHARPWSGLLPENSGHVDAPCVQRYHVIHVGTAYHHRPDRS